MTTVSAMPGKPSVVTVTNLKAHALALVARVGSTGRTVVITKRGKPIAQLVPYRAIGKAVPGRLRGTAIELGDIVAPTGAEWDAAK
jgi:prevent-host-death family protein